MKKINLPDRYLMTKKFLRGEICVVVDKSIPADGKDSVERDGRYWNFSDGTRVHCRFDEGDRVAVLQSYRDAGLPKCKFGDCLGWTKKVSVNPKYMPTAMVIDKVRVMRVKELTDAEMCKSGVIPAGKKWQIGGEIGGAENTPAESFARMFNRRFSELWDENPWVVVYDITPVGIGEIKGR